MELSQWIPPFGAVGPVGSALWARPCGAAGSASTARARGSSSPPGGLDLPHEVSEMCLLQGKE